MVRPCRDGRGSEPADYCHVRVREECLVSAPVLHAAAGQVGRSEVARTTTRYLCYHGEPPVDF